MTEKPPFVLGHESVGRRPNIRVELMRLRKDPLWSFLEAIDGQAVRLLSDSRTRYQDAYVFYYLSLDRYLREMSIAARYSRSPYWVRRSGGREKYGKNQKKLAARYNQTAPFLEFDIANCLIHSRILLDRVAGLSRAFLTGRILPSFTSFSDHKRFFEHLTEPYGAHEEYADYIRARTRWFEMPLREVRDKFIVHAAPKHMRFLGYRSEHELDLNIIVPDDPRSEKPLASVKVVTVNVLRLSDEIHDFLKWFCNYGLTCLSIGKLKSSM